LEKVVAEQHEIQITLLPDGRVEYTIKGIKGRKCEDIAGLLKALGQVEHEENTTEYYEQESEVGIHLQH
jgi:hypothetical protein